MIATVSMPLSTTHPQGRRTRRFPAGVLLLLFWALTPVAWGQIRFTAQVDQTQVVVGEKIRYKLLLETTGERADGGPVVGDWGGLTKVIGPSSSNQMSLSSISGVQTMQYVQTFDYELQATQAGRFTIPPAQIGVAGKTYQTQPVIIEASVQRPQNVPNDLQGEAISQARTGDDDVDRQLEGRLFVRAVVSTKTPSVREPVIITYLLYNDRVALRGDFDAQPGDTQGTVTDQLFVASQLNFKIVQHGTRQYQVAQIFRQALTPTKAGPLTVNGLRLKLSIPVRRQSRSNDPFDSFMNDPFFGGGSVQAEMECPPLQLDVRPLPQTGQPPDFTGTVGDFTITAEADRKQLTEDDLVTLRLTLEGKGAIDLAYQPVFPRQTDFQVVGQSTRATEKKNTQDGIGGRKVFEMVLRPLRAGEHQIPEIRYPIYNPVAGRYVELVTQGLPVKVAPGKMTLTSGPSVPQPGILLRPGGGAEQLHYLHNLGLLRPRRPAPLLESWVFWLIHLAAAGLVLGAWQRSRRLANIDPARVRRHGAWRQLERRLRAIHIRQRSASPQEVAGEVDHAARSFIADRFNLSADGLTRPEIERLLLGHAVPEARVQRLCDLIEHVEGLRYAPLGTVDGELDGWMSEIVTILKENLRE